MKEGNKKLRLQQFIKDFNLIIKQRYRIVYSVERKQTLKTEKVQRLRKANAFIKMCSMWQ